MEPFEPPHDASVVGLVDSPPRAAREYSHLGCVRGHRDLADYVRTKVALFEDSFEPDRNLYFVLLRVLLDNGYNLEGQVDVLTDPVGHHVEDAIGRDERDRSVTVESAQTHALVELNIINLDAFISWFLGYDCRSRTPTLTLHKKLVVDAELAFWHTGEERLDTDAAIHVSLEHRASR